MALSRRTFLKTTGTAPAIPAILCAQGAATSHQSHETKMEIKRVGSQPSINGPADWFTGTVRIDPLFQANAPARTSGASVTFEPGARTAWHTHPLGQMTHIAIQEALDGKVVDWMEKVSDDQYRGEVPRQPVSQFDDRSTRPFLDRQGHATGDQRVNTVTARRETSR